MAHARSVTRHSLVLLCTAAVTASSLVALPGPATAAAAAPGHDRIVSAVPKQATPNVQDESVDAILDAGDKIVAAGEFTRVRSPGATRDEVRNYIFAFDEDTGVVDEGFAPVVDGVVTSVIAGPTDGTVFIGGRFTTIGEGDAAQKRSKVALLNLADGSVVETFKAPAINGAVMDLALVGDRLIVGGSFTQVGGGTSAVPRQGLVSLNADTGAVDEYLTVGLTENHSWTEGSTGVAKAPVGVDKLAVSPDGSQLVAIGNFKKANGELHDQVVKLDLGGTSATIANWNTERYQAVCAPAKFDSYVRDVAFSPDGSYFVIVTTGTGVANTLCDAAARWEADATGSALQPTWVAASGGDTILSVAVSEKVVYVGGHMRWMNNPLAKDVAGHGAIGRASIAALDPRTGLPTRWNPGRNPRGYGITELHLTSDGLWIGHDQEWIGNQEYKHDRIAFFPLAGGDTMHSTATDSLPGDVYLFGRNLPASALFRVNAGGEAIGAADGGPNWQADTAAAPSRYHNSGLRFNAGRPWIENVKVPPVSAATPRDIYGSELLGSGAVPNINWDIPVARGTKITVRLYFSTRCGCAPGTRKFNINIDGVRKASNYDPTGAAGGDGIGTMLSYSVTSDGNVDIDLLKVLGSPVVNAIEILRNPAPAAVGNEDQTDKRTFDGDAGIGPRTRLTTNEAFTWAAGRAGFMVGGTLFHLHGRSFYRRTFDGTTFGPRTSVNPYSDPTWDAALTYSGPEGQTFAGKLADFYYEIVSITGVFYANGRIYYTIAGHPALYWRWFNPDSGAVGAVREVAPASATFGGSGGVFISGDDLYVVARTNGNLIRMGWEGGAAVGTPETISGPTVDGQDWRAKLVFVGP